MNSAEIARALQGGWLLAKLNPQGMRAFGDTVQEFWRSFQAAVVAAPGYFLLVILQSDQHPISDDPGRAFFAEILIYAIGWLAYPVCAWWLVQALEKEDRYIQYIIAYNWAIVIQLLAYVPVAVLYNLDILPGQLTGIIALLATGLIVYYQYFIARVALEIDMLPALGFVALDLVLSLALQLVGDWMQLQG